MRSYLLDGVDSDDDPSLYPKSRVQLCIRFVLVLLRSLGIFACVYVMFFVAVVFARRRRVKCVVRIS